jgi:endoglucanase
MAGSFNYVSFFFLFTVNCFKVRFLIFLLLYVASYPGTASDIVNVFALNSRIIVVHFDDGYVEYHGKGQSRQMDRVISEPLDVIEAENLQNYMISSSSGYYASERFPLKLERKSKGMEFTWLCQGWSQSTGCLNTSPDHVKEHWVYLYLPEPLEMDQIYTVTSGNIAGNGDAWEVDFSLSGNRTEAIHVNLVGYDPRAPQKYGYVYHWSGTGGGIDFSFYNGNPFYLIDTQSGEKVYTGTLNFRKGKYNIETMQPDDTPNQNFLGADVYECDFSEFSTQGEYYLAVEGLGRSFSFRIEKDIYRHPFYTSIRGLYHNRSGIELSEPYTTFTRPAPHNPLVTPGFSGRLFYTSSRFIDWNNLNHSASDLPAIEAGIKGPLDTWGWYQDAGDWDGYFWHMKVPVLLMLTWEIAPGKFADGELNLPEGKNGIPDILDEAAWLIRFFHRTRHEILDEGYGTGGVGSRVAPDWYGHAENGVPSYEDTGKWIISGEDPFTTYFYAGLAAHYALILKKLGISDPEGIDWQIEAEEAYEWALANTRPGDANPLERHNYDLMNFRYYAAAGLFRLTGDEKYSTIIEIALSKISSNTILDEDMKWGTYSLAVASETEIGDSFLQKINGAVLATAEQKFTSIDRRATRYGGNIWLPMVIGQGTTPRVFEIIMGHYVSKSAAPSRTEGYLAGLFTTADYFLGTNPHNMTWITNVGVRYPERVMHLDSWYSETGEIIPGITPYGPWRDQSGGSTIGPWDLRWPYKTLYPGGIENWPGHERWFNNYTTPANAEFTVHQNTVLSAVVYGYLCDEPDGTFQPNRHPSIQIKSPLNNSENEGALTIEVDVSDPDGHSDIAWVEFYNDWHKIGQSNEPPYTFTWLKPPVGNVIVSGKVVDKSGFSAKSEKVSVKISPVTGIDERQNQKAALMKVYPNPVTGLLQIESGSEIKKAGIYNLTGSRQVPGIHLNSKNQLDLSSLTQGFYLIKVEFSDGTFHMQKVIKK